jgi:hypothetical protein
VVLPVPNHNLHQMQRNMSTQSLPPSQRGLGNLHWGQQVDLTSILKEKNGYDPVSNPDGLIDLSGAINQLMPDYLHKIAEKFTAAHKLDSSMYLIVPLE